MLPELGPAPDDVDQATLREAIRCALVAIAPSDGALLVLDDLQWADAATLELLTDPRAHARGHRDPRSSAPTAPTSSPRDHPLRRMRNELRRTRALDEIALGPLDEAGTAALVEATLGGKPSRPLARTIHDRSQGLPFFVEELASALAAEDRLQRGKRGPRAGRGQRRRRSPRPIRDAVLLRCSDLSPEGKEAAEVAAVAGERFRLELVVELAGEAGRGRADRAGPHPRVG